MTTLNAHKQIAERIEKEQVIVKGQVRIPLRVLGPPPCPHLSRSGPAMRTMICKYASKCAGHEMYTSGIRCRHECPVNGGPQGGREITEEEKGRFMAWMLSGHYRAWNPSYSGIDKYIRKLASNPRFFVPPEAREIKLKTMHLLDHPNVVTVAAVGSLAIETVPRPLKDHDLMLVVKDFDRYCDERDEMRALLPNTHPDRTDWFVGNSMSGTLGAVDLFTYKLHLSYDFPHEVGFGISEVVHHDMLGVWPERFQELIDQMRNTEIPKISGEQAKKNWNQNKSLWTKASSFAKSLLSGREVDEETYTQRHISCHGTKPDGTVVAKPCSYRKKSRRDGYFCSVCGCGDKKIANLSPDPETGKSKLQFVELTCPLGKKGFSNGSDQP